MSTEAIKQRLSLRQPLAEALDIVADLAERLPLKSSQTNAAEALAAVREVYPTCADFERSFPSVCFSIATGVGKTRLMGACVAYLFREKGIRNFFILAPNLTIYHKLIKDFGEPSYKKYVFQGIAEFAHRRPVVITGDNYNQVSDLFDKDEVRINIFNVSKFNADSKTITKSGQKQPPRLKRLSEYLGQSYWDYLSNLDDLVMLMDEAHRYHASASKSAINELNPALGIELTATPFDEKGNQFKNVVYEYSLARALADGKYVKNPAISTRKNFSTQGLTDDEVEKIKLEDAISVHQSTQAELQRYALETGRELVKPFVLVVCRDTTHARAVYEHVTGMDFYEGYFKNKALQIDSTTRNEEEVEQQFVNLEKPDNEIEIVIHVNMLKEGWDVTNLYTIVPLRAANAGTLIEQTIGRGLRLPYGERTGEAKIDKLTIIAHDNFERIVQAAQDPNSVLNKLQYVEIDEAELTDRPVVITAKSSIEAELEAEAATIATETNDEVRQIKQVQHDARKVLMSVLTTTASAIPEVHSIADLQRPEVKEQVMQKIESVLSTGQLGLFTAHVVEEAAAIYETEVRKLEAKIIEIPQITVAPGAVRLVLHPFVLDTSGGTPDADFNLQLLDDEIIIRGLKDNSVDTIQVRRGEQFAPADQQLLTELLNYPSIDYDSQAEVLGALVDTVIEAVRLHFSTERDLRLAVFQWRRLIAQRIYAQIRPHFELQQENFKVSQVLPFKRIESHHFTALPNAKKFYYDTSFAAREVPRMVFRGFAKACHQEYKFDSRSEQLFAGVLENDIVVQKWLRPAPFQFNIYWGKTRQQRYEPDFVAETATGIYLLEVKNADEISSEEVAEKSKAAALYCRQASDYTLQNAGKRWFYAVIPHNQIALNSSFMGLVAANLRK